MSRLRGQHNLLPNARSFEPIAYNPFAPMLLSRDPVRIDSCGINAVPAVLHPGVQQAMRLNLRLSDTDLSHSKAQRRDMNIGSGKPHAVHRRFDRVQMERSTVLKIRYGKDRTRKHLRMTLGAVGHLLRKFSIAPEQRHISAVPGWKQRIFQ